MDVYLVSEFGAQTGPRRGPAGAARRPGDTDLGGHPTMRHQGHRDALGTIGFHDITIRDCVERNHIIKLHVYDDGFHRAARA
jgi:hypothetical protein